MCSIQNQMQESNRKKYASTQTQGTRFLLNDFKTLFLFSCIFNGLILWSLPKQCLFADHQPAGRRYELIQMLHSSGSPPLLLWALSNKLHKQQEGLLPMALSQATIIDLWLGFTLPLGLLNGLRNLSNLLPHCYWNNHHTLSYTVNLHTLCLNSAALYGRLLIIHTNVWDKCWPT